MGRMARRRYTRERTRQWRSWSRVLMAAEGSHSRSNRCRPDPLECYRFLHSNNRNVAVVGRVLVYFNVFWMSPAFPTASDQIYGHYFELIIFPLAFFSLMASGQALPWMRIMEVLCKYVYYKTFVPQCGLFYSRFFLPSFLCLCEDQLLVCFCLPLFTTFYSTTLELRDVDRFSLLLGPALLLYKTPKQKVKWT